MTNLEDGWLPWSGGECPVAAGTVVEVEFRGGGIAESSSACEWYWPHDGDGIDIIAYRLARARTRTESEG